MIKNFACRISTVSVLAVVLFSLTVRMTAQNWSISGQSASDLRSQPAETKIYISNVNTLAAKWVFSTAGDVSAYSNRSRQRSVRACIRRLDGSMRRVRALQQPRHPCCDSVISNQQFPKHFTVHYVASAASAQCAKGIAAMRIYTAPGVSAYTGNSNQLNTYITLSPGTYNTVVQAWDNCGGVGKTPITISVK